MNFPRPIAFLAVATAMITACSLTDQVRRIDSSDAASDVVSNDTASDDVANDLVAMTDAGDTDSNDGAIDDADDASDDSSDGAMDAVSDAGLCDSTHVDCDGNTDNGCDADTNSDPNNCGGCLTRCSGGLSICTMGQCTAGGAQTVVAGDKHVCVLRESGVVTCWGRNVGGAVGNGSGSETIMPPSVVLDTSGSPLVGVVQVVGGTFHSCARTRSTVYCWGSNGQGQLGNGSTTPTARATPIATPDGGVFGAPQGLMAGSGHSCFIDFSRAAGNRTWCWGDNNRGQLGLGNATTTNLTTPALVPRLTGALHVAGARAQHTCAAVELASDGGTGVECWGDDTSLQLGFAAGDAGFIATPTFVPSDPDNEVAAGPYVSCSLDGLTGRMRCWGANGSGEHGNGATTAPSGPSLVQRGTITFAQMSVGDSHVCAITQSHNLFCWGSNVSGQLGADAGPGPVTTPFRISAFDGTAAFVAAGSSYTCLVTTTHSVYCWGLGMSGELGDGMNSMNTSPAAGMVTLP